MTKAALVVLAWLALIFGADEWLVRKAMRDLPPPKTKVVDLSRVPDDPPPPPPAPPLEKDVFP